ncbi:lipase maturation factor 1-like [Dryobates pubescens]|uniref:lipase maturation factor 1-like n=1 Tax=Dryobates pubescens TaxID=118200 RepID=UPI0023B8A817|nr:lipase maturation factor 1-like [Dryobates pubescens]
MLAAGSDMAAPSTALRHRQKRAVGSAAPEAPERAAAEPVGSEAKPPQGTFWLTRIVLLRSIALLYFVAFLVAYHQNKQLIGEKGLLPCKLYLQSVKKYFKGKINLDALSYAPTIIWFLDWSDMDSILDYLSLLGLAASAFVLLSGCANMVLMAVLWLLYLSLVNVGQIWMGIPAAGNRVPGDIPLPSLEPLPPAPALSSLPHRPLGLSVADLQDHAGSRAD